MADKDFHHGPVAKFIDPDWEDKVGSGIGLSHRPARLNRLAGQNDNPMPEATEYIPHSRTINLATGDYMSYSSKCRCFPYWYKKCNMI
jgi:hypothetical protein